MKIILFMIISNGYNISICKSLYYYISFENFEIDLEPVQINQKIVNTILFC